MIYERGAAVPFASSSEAPKKPLQQVKSGVISGLFYGDELSGAIGLSYDDFDRVTTRFRQLLGEDLIVTLPSPLSPTPLVLLLSHRRSV